MLRRIRKRFEIIGTAPKRLIELANNLTSGGWSTNQPSEESDGACLDRLADETEKEFLELAGKATGSNQFCFIMEFVD